MITVHAEMLVQVSVLHSCWDFAAFQDCVYLQGTFLWAESITSFGSSHTCTDGVWIVFCKRCKSCSQSSRPKNNKKNGNDSNKCYKGCCDTFIGDKALDNNALWKHNSTSSSYREWGVQHESWVAHKNIPTRQDAGTPVPTKTRKLTKFWSVIVLTSQRRINDSQKKAGLEWQIQISFRIQEVQKLIKMIKWI